MCKIQTTVRSDELSLLVNGIKRALLKRGALLKMGVDTNGHLWLHDTESGEICVVDLEGDVEAYRHSY